jgi:uncharacterized UBP type Zn finger protein
MRPIRPPVRDSPIRVRREVVITKSKPCEHYSGLSRTMPRTSGCEECMAIGTAWNELRVCLSCGHVGCCEDSEHAHALKHFQSTGHPVIASLERGEDWAWCYAHRKYSDLAPELKPKRPSALGALFARLFRTRSAS